ncbi:hypothetical protein [Halonotius roseus]|uniref:Uncharacterized protein n=1 Tax=Halonotius roseus TaxID=2511997 RepID=A0A544QPD6_9EURY|nr:hypothetical protein [Halonotius roseus]TQQ80792.1 hypothetical protein EWF95_09970 [Halonotius roseus]
MGLLATLKSWLGFGGDAASEADAETDDTPSEEPKLDPNGATETRVKSTDSAVDALKQTRNEAAETAETAEGDVADGDEPAPDGETADAKPEE